MQRGEVAPGTKTALVTGASSGIGYAIADRLAGLGYNIIAVSENAVQLAEAAEKLQQAHQAVKVTVHQADLAESDAAERLFEWSCGEGFEVDVLINDAGMFSFLDVLDTPVERIRRILLLHDMTTIMLCRLFGERMAARGEGHILNMSSYSLWMPFPGLALYSASKACLRSFSIAFAKEMREHGVKVTALCPAGVSTDLYGLSKSLQKLGLRLGVLISPESCARRGLKAMWRGRKSSVPGWWNRLGIPFCLYMPGWMTRILRRYTKRFQR
ncbi:MAG: SDR family NAD(P)-dependent oxidoreductase [Alistipes sp.]|nr:SDR family NAD(P)-dependent oxidoreductase [Alistipes sp.]